MRQRTLARAGMLVIAAGLLSACDGDRAAPLGPAERPEFAISAGPAPVAALTRKEPLSAEVTVAALIGRSGGAFAIPGAGLKVVVPPGAVQGPTRLTATALRGDLVAYEFGPHGATFRYPLKLTQDLRGTSWDTPQHWSLVEAGYFKDRSQLDYALGRASVDEFLPVVVDAPNSRLWFSVRHFSGYMVSSGRLLPQ